MGFFSSMSNAISSAVSSSVSLIGTYINRTVETIAPLISKGLDVWNKVTAIANVVMTIAEILKPGERLEEIGDRAMQAAIGGIKPEQFGHYDDYMTAIRHIELDPDKTESYHKKEMMMSGLSVCSYALDQKLKLADGTSGNLWLLAAANPEYFNGQRLNAIITSPNPVDIMYYFSGKLGPAGALSVEQKLLTLEKTLDPEKAEQLIYQDLDSAQAAMKRLPAA